MNLFRIVSLVVLISVSAPILQVRAANENDFGGELGLPEVVYHLDLPRRMFLEPKILLPEADEYIRPDFIAFFLKTLEAAPDTELRIDAARSLKTIHTKDLADLSEHASNVLRVLQSAEQTQLQEAAASLLISLKPKALAADVAAVFSPAQEVLSLQGEPGFVDWGGDVMRESWLSRIQSPEKFSEPLVDLACRGLADLKAAESLPTLENLLANRFLVFAKRNSAALAIGRINSARAAELAEPLLTDDLAARILAVGLLSHPESEAELKLMLKLCDDASTAIASRAWATVADRKAEMLLDRLNAGVTHQESNVRRTAVRVMRELPTAERCALLYRLTADVNLYVRNEARGALTDLTQSHPDLRDGILQSAGDVVRDSQSAWQSLEQAMVLLGDLRHREY
ncbi:MAG: hypothetical protein KDA89_07620, partial [Planctomycetaceae bacterium]|nr:hypothetical protein [Planctomycetaceae bacterium]